MKYFFSIIIPIYNSESFLIECIDSLINQKKIFFEIILINDYSSDSSLKICKDYKKKFNFIKIINNNKNIGVGKSRNKGINRSNGKYFIFLDSDDYLYPKCLYSLSKLIIKKKYPDLIFGYFDKNTYPYSNKKLLSDNSKFNHPDKLITYINEKNFPLEEAWPFIVKNNFIKKNNIKFQDIRIAEDEIFVIKILSLMKNYACFEEKFYYHRVHSSSLSSSVNFEATISYLKALISFNDFLKIQKLTKPKIKFIEKYMQSILSKFSSLLVLTSDNYIKKISFLLNKKIFSIRNLKKYPENISLSPSLSNNNIFTNLKNFKKSIIDYKKDIIISNYKPRLNIYLYCNSMFSESCIKILDDLDLPVINIVDDNEKLQGFEISNIKIINSKVLFNSKINIDKIFVIITNHRSSTCLKIRKNLLKKGLNTKQILIMNF